MHLCFGYCGWNIGQLELELLDGQWFIHPGAAKYVFDMNSDKIWQNLLRDMGGKYTVFSMIPADITMN